MCLAAWSIQQHERFPWVLASNRDEFFTRPTAPLGWWQPSVGGQEILSGRDLEAGGSWLGVTRLGRLALVTNVREPGRFAADALSRGSLVTAGLTADQVDAAWLDKVTEAPRNGFNFLVADLFTGECAWATNRAPQYRQVRAGLYGLSNASLDTPWPKVAMLKEKLADVLRVGADINVVDVANTNADINVNVAANVVAEQLFAALANPQIAADAVLPQTGVPLERERLLSSAFIRIADEGKAQAVYGTRCSTVVIAERVGDAKNATKIVRMFERVFDASGRVSNNTALQFEVV